MVAFWLHLGFYGCVLFILEALSGMFYVRRYERSSVGPCSVPVAFLLRTLTDGGRDRWRGNDTSGALRRILKALLVDKLATAVEAVIKLETQQCFASVNIRPVYGVDLTCRVLTVYIITRSEFPFFQNTRIHRVSSGLFCLWTQAMDQSPRGGFHKHFPMFVKEPEVRCGVPTFIRPYHEPD